MRVRPVNAATGRSGVAWGQIGWSFPKARAETVVDDTGPHVEGAIRRRGINVGVPLGYICEIPNMGQSIGEADCEDVRRRERGRVVVCDSCQRAEQPHI